MSELPGGQRLTPAQILLISVVSVLVLLFVVLLVGRLAGDEGRPTAGASTGGLETSDASAGASEAPSDGADASAEPEYFTSPSGNIVCALTPESADCIISNFEYEPTDAAGCEDETAGGHLRVEPAGASMPCEPLVVAGAVPALDYGESAEAHGYTCLSEESGVTCRHEESGSGFTVARASYKLF